MLTNGEVVELARAGRVAPAPNFHARSAHGATFEKLAQVLLFTFRVKRDNRPEHPDGYIAIARNWGGETYRIDFNLASDAQGDIIMTVTGWKYGEQLMSKTDEIVDPQLGKIQLPKPPRRAEAERLIEEQSRAFAAQRLWKDGSVSRCPSCGRESFVGRSDLSHEIGRPGGVVVFRHLKGAKCANCQGQSLEPSEQIQIEREAGIGQVADYEAKVSNIGSGTVGTYWPKDVVRVMKLSPDTRVFIQILDRETALIKFTKGRQIGKAPKVARTRKRSKKTARKPRRSIA